MEIYRKSADHVEVYVYSATDPSEILKVLAKGGAEYELVETPISFGIDKTYYKCTITIQQDGNTFVLTPGQYLVKDNMNTFSVYSEIRFKKLFDKIYSPY